MKLARIYDDAATLFENERTCVQLSKLEAAVLLAACDEAALCLVDGSGRLEMASMAPIEVNRQVALHIPSQTPWRFVAGSSGAHVLQIVSRHPGFDSSRRLMPALEDLDVVDISSERRFRYTDHFRGGMIVFPPGQGAEKHFHEGADEVFWFVQGECSLRTQEGNVICRPGDVAIFAAGEWHSLVNESGDQSLHLFFTVTPNIVPSHTYFRPDGTTYPRSMQPLTSP